MKIKRPNKRKKKFLKLNKLKIQDTKEDSDKCKESGKESPTKPVIFQIEPNLFVSGFQGARDRNILKSHGINHVINLTAHKFHNSHGDLVKYSSFCFSDHENFDLTKELPPVLKVMEEEMEQGRKVLVHCQEGISRAPSVVMAFLIKKRGMSYTESLEYVRERNPKTEQNFGFLLHLKNL